MRSRLEAEFAAMLDSMEVDWAYEPIRYADATGTYLPDFQVRNGFYECRPHPKADVVNEAIRISLPMHIIRASMPDAQLNVALGKWKDDHYEFDVYPICGPTKPCPCCEARQLVAAR